MIKLSLDKQTPYRYTLYYYNQIMKKSKYSLPLEVMEKYIKKIEKK